MSRRLACLLALAAGCARPEAPPAPSASASPPPAPVVATASTAVAYRISFPAPATHFVEVQATLPTRGRAELTLVMPVWTPGSYLVREYARHLERLAAFDPAGAPLAVRKVQKSRWVVATGGAPQVNLRYRIYARAQAVQQSYVDADYAVLVGAGTFLQDLDAPDAPYEVTVVRPDAYPDLAVALPWTPSGALMAADYDALVDAPLVLGPLRRRAFEVAGTPHELVTVGGDGVWPDDEAAAGAADVVRAARALWGPLDCPRYLFLNVVNGEGGGLEHRCSTLIMAQRFGARTPDALRAWLSLVAHEYFHANNGKRLRPEALGPFDYEREAYTHGLWFVEGFTSYYDDLLVRRAGRMSDEQYLETLSKQIERLEGTPGRLEQPLAMASFDAWIEFYRPDESSRNTTVSYYTKGAVVAFVLDAALRAATDGRRSLDDLMRLAHARYAGARGYDDAELLGLFEELGGPEVGALARRLVETTAPVPYDVALAYFGLRFRPDPDAVDPKASAEAQAAAERSRTWLGVYTQQRDGRLVISEVVVGGPAEQAGLQVDDELLALDGLRIPGADLAARTKLYRPGDTVRVDLARRGRMRQLALTFGARPRAHYGLEVHPGAASLTAARRRAWLEAPGPTRR